MVEQLALVLGWSDAFLLGAFHTLAVGVCAFVLGCGLGLVLLAAYRSDRRWLRVLAQGYVALVRGVPELLAVLVVFFGGGILYRAVTGSDLSPFVAGFVALGLIAAAFAAEVLRGAWNAVPKGQWDGAASLALPRRVVLLQVIGPQALRLALPGLTNLWLIVLKDTALVSVIAVHDILRVASVASQSSREPFTFYLAACLLYLVLTVASLQLQRFLPDRTGAERAGAGQAGRA